MPERFTLLCRARSRSVLAETSPALSLIHIWVELNAGYWLDGVKYLQAEERRSDMPTIFDLIGDES